MVPRAWLEDSATAGAGDARDDAWRGHEPPPRLVDVSKTPTSETPFRRASRSRLSPADARRFPGDDTFAAVARAVCSADVLPRKELFETWEAALVITEAFGERLRGGDLSSSAATTETRVADLAGGHGFLALALLVLNPALRSAVVVDRRKPESRATGPAPGEGVPEAQAARARAVRRGVRGGGGDAKRGRAVCRRTRVRRPERRRLGARRRGARARRARALLPPGPGSARRLAKRLDGVMPRGEAKKTKERGNETKRLAERRRRRRAAETLRRAGYDVAAATLPREITPQNRVILGAGAPRDDGEHSPREVNDASFDSVDVLRSPGWRSVAETLPRSPWKLVGGSTRGVSKTTGA